MRIPGRIISLLFTLCFAFNSYGQLKVTATTDSANYLIGDWIYLKLTAEHPENMTVLFPGRVDSLVGIEVLDIPNIDTIEDGDNLIQSQIIQCIVFDSGQYFIPPLPFGVINATGGIDTISTLGFTINVNTLEVDTSQPIKAIKDPLNVPFQLAEIKELLVILFAVLCLLGVIIWVLMRKKKEFPAIIRQKPRQAAHVIALKRLNDLAAKKLWQKGKVKEYYTELSEISREYLEYRYDILALESTTHEIIEDLKQLGLGQDIIISMNHILQNADMVKFAKAMPLPDQNEKFIRETISFVNETKESQPINELANAS